MDYITVFKALSDKTRVRMLHLMLQAKKELCICEIMDALSLAQYNVSKHIRELKLSGLTSERKEGRFVFYSLVRQKTIFHRTIIEAVRALPADNFAQDNKRLRRRLSLRKNGRCIVPIRNHSL